MVKLSVIKDALEDVDMNSTCYFNKETNEVLNNTVDFKLKRFKNKIKSTFTSKKNRKFKN